MTPTLKLPERFEIVLVYVSSDKNVTAFRLGFWDGNYWKDVFISENGKQSIPQVIKNVIGWEEIKPAKQEKNNNLVLIDALKYALNPLEVNSLFDVLNYKNQ